MMFIVGNFTGAIYVGERRLGLKARGAVVGVKFSHQIAASLITDSGIIIFQTLLLFTIQSQLYGAVFKGSLTLSLLLCYLSGISGVMFSIMLSEFVEDEIQMFTSLFFFDIIQFLCNGGFWPMICIPWLWRIICYCLPITFPLDSLRCVLFYGWGISHPKVLAGIGASFVWILGCGMVTWFVVRKKK